MTRHIFFNSEQSQLYLISFLLYSGYKLVLVFFKSVKVLILQLVKLKISVTNPDPGSVSFLSSQDTGP